jgi:hypothetical protein
MDVTVALLDGFASRCEPEFDRAELETVVRSAYRYRAPLSMDAIYNEEG